jgi:hypothetical protein
MSIEGSAGFNGVLKTRVTRAPAPKRVHSLRIPGLGRMMLTRDPGDAVLLAHEVFTSNLRAVHRNRRGEIVGVRDLGSGLVTNIGVLAMANDPFWSAQLNLATLTMANNHATGTGATAAAVTDFKLQTPSGFGGQTPVAGVQTLLPSGTAPKYQTVATVNYTGTESVTEWGLFSQTTLSSTTGSPFTATTATSGTVTGTPLTASSATVRGQQQTIVVPGTTAVWGLVTANTTSVLTIPAWYNQSNGAAGSTPGATEAYTLRPVMWDHRVFTSIGVNSGDSIQFTYQLTVNSGG